MSELLIPLGFHLGRQKRDTGERGAQNVYYVSRQQVITLQTKIPKSKSSLLLQALWTDAWFECRQGMGGELLSIETSNEQLFVRDLLIKHNIGTYSDTNMLT